jgi:hypothetical protein
MKASDVMIGAQEEFFCHALTIRRSRPLARSRPFHSRKFNMRQMPARTIQLHRGSLSSSLHIRRCTSSMQLSLSSDRSV